MSTCEKTSSLRRPATARPQPPLTLVQWSISTKKTMDELGKMATRAVLVLRLLCGPEKTQRAFKGSGATMDKACLSILKQITGADCDVGFVSQRDERTWGKPAGWGIGRGDDFYCIGVGEDEDSARMSALVQAANHILLRQK